MIKNLLGIPLNEPILPARIEEGLKACTKFLIDLVDITEVSIDGKDVMNLQDFRVQSPLFLITYPENNVFQVTNDTGIPQKAIAEGYWVLPDGLKAREHNIEFTGGASTLDFTTQVTYFLTIDPKHTTITIIIIIITTIMNTKVIPTNMRTTITITTMMTAEITVEMTKKMNITMTTEIIKRTIKKTMDIKSPITTVSMMTNMDMNTLKTLANMEMNMNMY